MIDNAFARDLGGIVQFGIGLMWAHDGSRRYVLGYSCAQLAPSSRASAITERESICTFATIACVVAAQLPQLL